MFNHFFIVFDYSIFVVKRTQKANVCLMFQAQLKQIKQEIRIVLSLCVCVCAISKFSAPNAEQQQQQ